MMVKRTCLIMMMIFAAAALWAVERPDSGLAVTGRAPIVESNLAKSRSEAFKNGYVSALKTVLFQVLKTDDWRDKQGLIKSSLLDNAFEFVEKKQIHQEGKSEGEYVIKMTVWLRMGQLKEKLKAYGLYGQAQIPLRAVIAVEVDRLYVKADSLGKDEGRRVGGFFSKAMSPVESAFIDVMKNAGYLAFAPAGQKKPQLDVPLFQAKRVTRGDLIIFGKAFGATDVIWGSVELKPSGRRCKAALEVRSVRVSSGQDVLELVEEGVPPYEGKDAEESCKGAAREVARKIYAQFTSETLEKVAEKSKSGIQDIATIEIKGSGLDLRKLGVLQNELKKSEESISAVTLQRVGAEGATLRVEGKGIDGRSVCNGFLSVSKAVQGLAMSIVQSGAKECIVRVQ